MNVYVHRGRIDFQKQRHRRIAPLGYVGMVSFDQGIGQCLAFHRPTIHEKQHLLSGRPPLPRLSQQAVQAIAVSLPFHGFHILGQTSAKDFMYPILQIGTSR